MLRIHLWLKCTLHLTCEANILVISYVILHMTRYVEWLKNMRNTACTFLVTVFYNYCYYIMCLFANGELCWMPIFYISYTFNCYYLCMCFILEREREKRVIGKVLTLITFSQQKKYIYFLIVDIIKYILYIRNVENMLMKNIPVAWMVMHNDQK